MVAVHTTTLPIYTATPATRVAVHTATLHFAVAVYNVFLQSFVVFTAVHTATHK